MSNTPLPGVAQCLKWLFIAFNFLFAVFGLALVGVGAWLIATGSGFNFVFNNGIVGGAALIIVCGVVTFVIATIGVLGAFFQNRVLLVVFAICLTVIVVVEIVGAILGFVFRERIESIFTDALNRGIQEYNTDEALRTLVDETQSGFMCCGFSNYTEWFDTAFYIQNGQFPDSCCANAPEMCMSNSTSFYTEPCVTAAANFLTNNIGYAIALGAVGLVIGLLEIAGIVLSLALCICIHKSKLTEV